MKRLLLHICCAPDATVGIERMAAGWATEGLFYNPNVQPVEEYQKRLHAMEALSELLGFSFQAGPYDPGQWRVMVRGLEDEPEKGLRCEACILERLRATARLARERGFDAFAAVLTVSPHKDAGMVNRLGARAGEEFGIPYISTDLKKLDGFKRSVELSRQYGIYRQEYCGCIYSRSKNAGRSTQDTEDKT